MYERRKESALTTKWYKDTSENIVCERVLNYGVALVESFNLHSKVVTEKLVNLTINVTMSSKQSVFDPKYLSSLVDLKSIKSFEH